MSDSGTYSFQMLSGTRGHGTAIDFTPSFWKRLSPELLDLVLTKLPFSDLMRLRCVSKSWNAKIISHSFARPENHDPKCVLTQYKCVPQGLGDCLTVYDSSSHVWEKLSLGFLDSIDIASARLVGSGGGLLVFCGATRADGRPHHLRMNQLIVCNPLTKVHQKLRLLGVGAPTCVGVICHSENYQLILVGKEPFYEERPRIYNSSTKTWRKGALIPIPHASLSGGVLCGGLFYCMNDMNPHRHEVLAYQPQKDSWSTIDRPESSFIEAGIAPHEGRLLLLTVAGAGDIDIHVLVEEGREMRWEMLKKMPRRVRSASTGTRYFGPGDWLGGGFWRVLGDGKFIYLFGYERRSVERHGVTPGAKSVVLEHNLSTNSWRWLKALEDEDVHPQSLDFIILKPSFEILNSFPVSISSG